MEHETIAEKLDEYYRRFEDGKAAKIEPAHVQRAIASLRTRRDLLLQELQDAEKPVKKDRIEQKLETLQKQIERAEWLLARIET